MPGFGHFRWLVLARMMTVLTPKLQMHIALPNSMADLWCADEALNYFSTLVNETDYHYVCPNSEINIGNRNLKCYWIWIWIWTDLTQCHRCPSSVRPSPLLLT